MMGMCKLVARRCIVALTGILSLFGAWADSTEVNPVVESVVASQIGYSHAKVHATITSLGLDAASGALFYAIKPEGSADDFNFNAFEPVRATSTGLYEQL